MLDARERGCAGSTAWAGDDDVVREGFGNPRRDGADTEGRDQLDADSGTRVDALQVVYKLRKVFDGVDVMMRRGTDEHYARLRMAQARDQLRDLVRGELPPLAWLRALRDLDLDFFRVGQILRGDAEASGGELFDLIVVQAATAGEWIGCPHNGILSAFTSVRARSEDVHTFGDCSVRLGTE